LSYIHHHIRKIPFFRCRVKEIYRIEVTTWPTACGIKILSRYVIALSICVWPSLSVIIP